MDLQVKQLHRNTVLDDWFHVMYLPCQDSPHILLISIQLNYIVDVAFKSIPMENLGVNIFPNVGITVGWVL